MEENRRLKEIKLSLYINYIDRTKNKVDYSNLIKMLSALSASLSQESNKEFMKVIQLTIGKCLLKATDKELIATCKRYFSHKRASKLFGMSHTQFNNKYGDLLNRNYDNEEYLKSLSPMFNSEHGAVMIDFLVRFIEKFKYELGSDDNDICDNNRTLEIEFLLIYNKLVEVLTNVGLCDKFIFNICNLCDIDFSSISQLKNNIHIINRSYPNFRYNNRYLMQEIVTLCTHKGLSKGTIGSKVLGKTSSYLYNGTNKKYDIISEENMDWQYTATLDWTNIDKNSVKKFIDLFHTFIKYEL